MADSETWQWLKSVRRAGISKIPDGAKVFVHDGTCNRCLLAPSEPGIKTCAKCRAEMAAINKRNYMQKRAAGLCVACGLPSEKSNCPACAEKARARRNRKS